jgi:hypothetical protein
MPVKASVAEIPVCFPVTLKFQGENLPSFKNSKLLTRGKLITKPEYQRVMQQIIRAFESGLRSATQTNADATWMVDSPAPWIVLLRHLRGFDDNRFWVSSITVDCLDVPKGEEGCDLTLDIL